MPTPTMSLRNAARLTILFCVAFCAGLAAATAPAAQQQRPQRAAPAPPQAAASAPVLAGVDARLESGEASARFQISLSGEVTLQSEALTQPRRIVVDLPEIAFQAAQGARRRKDWCAPSAPAPSRPGARASSSS